ncbi:MAG: D-2-hydroxyacid dehydrogenase [Clostridium sp.]|nr:D-2-hydroxyacid dehydrogenase [Clostridium sp.]
MNIVVLDGYTENPGDLSWDGLSALGKLTVHDRTSLINEAEIQERLLGADAVYTNKTPLSGATLKKAASTLRFVGVLATGFNVVDVAAARELGITVCNIPTYGTAAVGQFAIAMLLELCHHVGHHDQAVHEGRWSSCPDWCFWDYPLIELDGKTMGIIGFGRIGQATGRLAKALGMKVLAYDEYPSQSGADLAEYTDMDTLLSSSDVIALHCPLLPSTYEIINKDTIARMKNGVIILNNSRGPLIAEQDLADALASGKVYGAGLDVVAKEPIQPDNPLLSAPNCIITPHISWAPRESRQRLMDAAVDNLVQFLNGTPVNVVNK